ncbi:hypothetical protein KKF34_15340 [Myxococcota bacterium]|nr:hypothetical protein [Myxococcota bacterium]MBU1383078.1 hypothetical protein [Myxococcota bacterium]MBU1498251.1 hypothetical protein [Myxococcota bacterium]
MILFIVAITVFWQQSDNNPDAIPEKSMDLPVTIRGTCFFRLDPKPALMDKFDSAPISGKEITLVSSGKKIKVKTRKDGTFLIELRGNISASLEDDLVYEKCSVKLYIKPVTARKKWKVPWRTVLLLVVSLILLIAVILRRFRMYRRKVIKDVSGDNELIRLESSGFSVRDLFGQPRWRGNITNYRSLNALSNVIIKLTDSNGSETTISSDSQGNFAFSGHYRKAVFQLEGFKTATHALKNGGFLKVQLMSLREYALDLLMQLIKKHLPEKAPFLTPREALKAAIPPPEVINRIEELAYRDEIIDENEIIKIWENIIKE